MRSPAFAVRRAGSFGAFFTWYSGREETKARVRPSRASAIRVAGGSDQERTEEATPRALDEALGRGQIARSSELTGALLLLAAALLPAGALVLESACMEPGAALFVLVPSLGFLLFIESEVGVGARRRWCGPLAACAAFLSFLLHGVLGVLLPALAIKRLAAVGPEPALPTLGDQPCRFFG